MQFLSGIRSQGSGSLLQFLKTILQVNRLAMVMFVKQSLQKSGPTLDAMLHGRQLLGDAQ